MGVGEVKAEEEGEGEEVQVEGGGEGQTVKNEEGWVVGGKREEEEEQQQQEEEEEPEPGVEYEGIMMNRNRDLFDDDHRQVWKRMNLKSHERES